MILAHLSYIIQVPIAHRKLFDALGNVFSSRIVTAHHFILHIYKIKDEARSLINLI